MAVLRSVFFALAMLCGPALHAASRLSYVYIQGDKQTPFYVKLEDTMQPRFGKNYCILPQLEAGVVHLEILFQQNAFPPQKFAVNVPDGGSRGFLLVQRDGAFSLYDLQGGFYLPAGNEAEEDRIVAAPPALYAPIPRELPVAAGSNENNNDKPLDARTTGMPASANSPVANGSDRTQPKFINGLELKNGASPKTGESVTPATPAITNSDCPAPLDAEEFKAIFGGLAKEASDEDRVDYLSRNLDKCYASWMARALTMRMQSDAARFSFLRSVYPRITDQAAFALLDDLLTTDTWRDAFLKMVAR